MLLSFVTERLDEIDVQILIAGDQVPKALTADVKVKTVIDRVEFLVDEDR